MLPDERWALAREPAAVRTLLWHTHAQYRKGLHLVGFRASAELDHRPPTSFGGAPCHVSSPSVPHPSHARQRVRCCGRDGDVVTASITAPSEPAALLALAARVEAQGRYNVAKLLRAAATARLQREADERLAAAPRSDALLTALGEVADAWEHDALLAPLAGPLRVGTAVFAAGDVPLLADVPDPIVCRRCGYVALSLPTGEPPAAAPPCPRCGAAQVTFLVQRPVWWLERYDPPAAMALLARTPVVVRAMLERIPEGERRRRPAPEVWSPHEVLAHLRDAQGVLEQRVGLILERDEPDLEAKMVWSWNREDRPVSTDAVLGDYLSSRERVLERLRAVPAGAWWRTGRHGEFGRLTLTQQVSYFAAHEPTHLRQLRPVPG